MKYYVIIGHKAGEGFGDSNGDWVEVIERDDEYSYNDYPPGAHQFFGYLDINFNESVQYGVRATKTQEAWLIGRHRIARSLDFGNFGYQFVRASDTKRIQFPDKIKLSFDKQIRDNYVNRPSNDANRVDIELTELNQQILQCFDKECTIDPIVFKLAQFDNYGDAYIDLQEIKNYQDFEANIDSFVHFLKNYPNSNVYLSCQKSQEIQIKQLLKRKIQSEHLTNYFEFCEPNFERRSPGYSRVKSGEPHSEYDTFAETIEEFFNEHAFKRSAESESNFYRVPFKKAKITISNNLQRDNWQSNNWQSNNWQRNNWQGNSWSVYSRSEKFIKFLQYNPDIRLEIEGPVAVSDLVRFIETNSIKASVVLINDPNNLDVINAIAQNRKAQIEAIIEQHGYANLDNPSEEFENNEEFRLSIERYRAQQLTLTDEVDGNEFNENLHVVLNQNLDQNQNLDLHLRQANHFPTESVNLEITSKLKIPDVTFASNEALLKSIIGLDFKDKGNLPQTEAKINSILLEMEKIINASSSSRNCYFPLGYGAANIIAGASYIPKAKVGEVARSKSNLYAFDKTKDTLFFSPPFASIAIKKDKYAFKLHHRPVDTSAASSADELNPSIIQDDVLNGLVNDSDETIIPLLNKLYYKRGQVGINLLSSALYSVKQRNENTYNTLVKHYLPTSKDLSEFTDNPQFFSTIEGLAKLKDKKKVDWWNKLLEIQCKTNPNFDFVHLFSQFEGFWRDLDKLQKFLPIPAEFPLDDFADAGVALGKIFRIMINARNRFEQIQSFEGGNISHAYMLLDLFNISMYSKEMDTYCALLTNQLNAEDAFDKKALKQNYFSTKKLAALSEDDSMNLEQFKSYLLVYAAVNGTTQKLNNSDLAFYKNLFNTVDEVLANQTYNESEKKLVYSTIMLFAACGNNTTKDRIKQDIKLFASNPNLLDTCQTIWTLYKQDLVSDFFSAEEDRTMANSDAMLSFHALVKFSNESSFKEKLASVTDLIIKNKFLSPALQKLIKEKPSALQLHSSFSDLAGNSSDEKDNLIKSLFLVCCGLSDTIYSLHHVNRDLESIGQSNLAYLNQLVLDIDFTKLPVPNTLFNGSSLSRTFCSNAAKAKSLDDLLFLLQDHHLVFKTIKPSQKGLLARIAQLENNLENAANKQHYVNNYQELILKRMHALLGDERQVEQFKQGFIGKINGSYSPDVLKKSYSSLYQILNIKKEELVKIISSLEQFPIGNNSSQITPDALLKVAAFLLKNNYSVDKTVEFLGTVKQGSALTVNNKLIYLKSLFEEIESDASCHERNDLKKKVTKQTKKQIEACINLVMKVDSIDSNLFKDLFKNNTSNSWSFSNIVWGASSTLDQGKISTPQYLEFLAALASESNIDSPLIKNEFNQINRALHNLLEQYPDSFSDVLEIAKFDVGLILNLANYNRKDISLIAKICKNELRLNTRIKEPLAADYKKIFRENIKNLLDRNLDLFKFYSNKQLTQPSAAILVKLLNHYSNNLNKAFHHFEKDPWFNRPHKKRDINSKEPVKNKELAYEMGEFDISKQNDVIDYITQRDAPFEKSVRRNLLFNFSKYINELGFRLPAFDHVKDGESVKVAARKLSDEELKSAFDKAKETLAVLRSKGQDTIWQNKKYQREVCKLLTVLREVIRRSENLTPYSTQLDSVILALLAGDFQYAMQINTGEGKAIIALFIALAAQSITGKQIVITTSTMNLAERDSEKFKKLTAWAGISHETIASTTQDKRKLLAKIIYTTGNDFSLFHGKNLRINNSDRIYINDESDSTKLHLTPAINSQSKQNEEETWWIYEEILSYVSKMDRAEARKRPEQQVQHLMDGLRQAYEKEIQKYEAELTQKLHDIDQSGESLDEQMIAKENLEREYNQKIGFYAKRVTKLNHDETFDQFDTLIDSAIIAQFVLKKGEGYEVINHTEDGKQFKKVVPTEGGKPIVEGDVLYMYGIHQFLIQKEILADEDANVFIKASELESTTYFNNYATQAGSKTIGITGTVPKAHYKVYEDFISGGKSDVIPPHRESKRIDVVPYEELKNIAVGHEHVCQDEKQLIKKLAAAIRAHDGPVLIYCNNNNGCDARLAALAAELNDPEYTVQKIVSGVTEDFTEGGELTNLGKQAQKQKTITLTVGDGRGIDLSAEGSDGLLSVCSFVPETPEKLLQIYGRAGRNGSPGKTSLFLLESELTKYGITFNNLDQEFKFLDELRHKEFNFLIKKIGFMQYEVQKEIEDEEKKINALTYMDDLYNKLILKAVATKIKSQQRNWVGEHQISGRWEPYAMLNERELDEIYHEFCTSLTNKLESWDLDHINCKEINRLQKDYERKANEAIAQEKTDQKGHRKEEIHNKLHNNTQKQNRFWKPANTNVELPDGTEIDVSNVEVNGVYKQFAMNWGKYDKTISLIQKHIGTHIGIYGFIHPEIETPYGEIYQLLENEKQSIKQAQEIAKNNFYNYLINKEMLSGITLLLDDCQFKTQKNHARVDEHFKRAGRYALMTKDTFVPNLDSFSQMVFDYYEMEKPLEESSLINHQNNFSRDVKIHEQIIKNSESVIVEQCKNFYERVQNKLFTEADPALKELTDRPMRSNDPKLADLFAMLQMATKQERESESVQKIINDYAPTINSKVDEFNGRVQTYKEIIKKQRACFEVLGKVNDSRTKIYKYTEMVSFTQLASKNMVNFYHDYSKLPATTKSLNKDIDEEMKQLAELELEVRLFKRKQYADQVERKINFALNTLKERINKIEHPSSRALKVARQLFEDLQKTQVDYIGKLRTTLAELPKDKDDFLSDIKHLNEEYTQQCDALINNRKTRSVLENDLHWGPYLKNLLKMLANAVISIFTSDKNRLFKLEESETIKIINDSEPKLRPDFKRPTA